MSTQTEAAAGASPLTGWLGRHPIFLAIHQRPGLLLREIAWRWTCGSLLLALAGFAAGRVWAAALPALRSAGLFVLTPDSLLADPAQIASTLPASFDVLRPSLERAALGLTPLAVFLWVWGFAVGRAQVLARFDPQLPRRPWLLAQGEAVRLGGILLAAIAWAALAHGAYLLTFRGEDPHIFVYLALLLGITLGMGRLTGRFNRALFIGLALALVRSRPLASSFSRAWHMDEHTRIVPLRKAVGRIRAYLLAAAVLLAFVPAPFHFGWALAAWWLVFSLPPLVAADAWRLGAFFALLRAFQNEDGQETEPVN